MKRAPKARRHDPVGTAGWATWGRVRPASERRRVNGAWPEVLSALMTATGAAKAEIESAQTKAAANERIPAELLRVMGRGHTIRAGARRNGKY